VPTSRATLIRPKPFGSRDEAETWLSGLRQDREQTDGELHEATRRLSRALHAQRVAAADPHVVGATPEKALAVRIGFGAGEEVADGRYTSAWELPQESRRRARRSMEAPEERFAAILGARERVLACEELVLRARADLDAGRLREAALQARVALEALLAELPGTDLAAEREAVGEAANAALGGDLSGEAEAALFTAVERMEAALKRRRLGA
jgi:regulator of protease activity HflC (stomatin/prohibitin superfamily)